MAQQKSSMIGAGVTQSGCRQIRSDRKFVPLRAVAPRMKTGPVTLGADEFTAVMCDPKADRLALGNFRK